VLCTSKSCSYNIDQIKQAYTVYVVIGRCYLNRERCQQVRVISYALNRCSFVFFFASLHA